MLRSYLIPEISSQGSLTPVDIHHSLLLFRHLFVCPLTYISLSRYLIDLSYLFSFNFFSFYFFSMPHFTMYSLFLTFVIWICNILTACSWPIGIILLIIIHYFKIYKLECHIKDLALVRRTIVICSSLAAKCKKGRRLSSNLKIKAASLPPSTRPKDLPTPVPSCRLFNRHCPLSRLFNTEGFIPGELTQLEHSKKVPVIIQFTVTYWLTISTRLIRAPTISFTKLTLLNHISHRHKTNLGKIHRFVRMLPTKPRALVVYCSLDPKTFRT